MLLVFGLTKATQDGWTSALTLGSLIASAALLVLFLGIERRAESPLLPFAAFRGTTLGIGGAITAIIASIGFSQFFLLTLYLQQVLHYSAARSGVAFTAIAVTVAITSNIGQRLVTTLGARTVLGAGLLAGAIAEALFIRLPEHGSYVVDLLPAFILTGISLGLGFVAVTIASLAGTRPQYAGVASGLVNTSRQIGGAVGLAVMTTIASLAAGHSTSPAAIVHGDHVAFAVLTVLALAALALTPALRPHREAERSAPDVTYVLEEAA